MLRRLIDDDLVDYVAMDIKAPLSRYSDVARSPIETADVDRSIEILLRFSLFNIIPTVIEIALVFAILWLALDVRIALVTIVAMGIVVLLSGLGI